MVATKVIFTSFAVGMAIGACKPRRPVDYAALKAGASAIDKTFKMPGRLDAFCPGARGYDRYNAYILAQYSEIAYIRVPDSFALLTAPAGNKVELATSAPVFGAGIHPQGVRFFTSSVPDGTNHRNSPSASLLRDVLDRQWKEEPLPLELCYSPAHNHCIGLDKPDARGCDVPHPIDVMGQAEEPIIQQEMLNKNLEQIRKFVRVVKEKNRTIDEARDELPSWAPLLDPYVVRLHAVNKNHRLLGKEQWDLAVLADETDPTGGSRQMRSCEYWRNSDPFMAATRTFADTQATWVEGSDFAVLAFRGTEPVLLEGESDSSESILGALDREPDLHTDLAATQTPCPNSFDGKSRQDIALHTGFCHAAAIAAKWVGSRVQSLIGSGKRLYITGHSLGGAVATITYYHLLNAMDAGSFRMTDDQIGGLYTYGSPRVGNRAFAAHFHQLARAHRAPIYRHVNMEDLVTKVPYSDFYHVGNLVWYPIESGNRQANSPQWVMNPGTPENLKAVFQRIAPEIVSRQVEVLKGAVQAFWSLPYLSLINDLVTDFARFRKQALDHGLGAYSEHLWDAIPSEEKQAGPERCAQLKVDAQAQAEFNFMDEANLRN